MEIKQMAEAERQEEEAERQRAEERQRRAEHEQRRAEQEAEEHRLNHPLHAAAHDGRTADLTIGLTAKDTVGQLRAGTPRQAII